MNVIKLISQMTLEEKTALQGGVGACETRALPRLGIPSIRFADVSNGICYDPVDASEDSLTATCFPAPGTMAASWDEELAAEVGKALGEEAKALEIDVLLGPELNIKKNPLSGRNPGCLSEDPYLTGKLGAAQIRGIQSQGTSACAKQFAVSSRQERRMSLNAVLDERTLREIYLTGFEMAVREGNPDVVMTACNQINGTFANENEYLLKQILRGEWEFPGLVLTAPGGSNERAAAVNAGSDLVMPDPGLNSARKLAQAVRAGEASEEELNERVREVLEAVFAHKDGFSWYEYDFDRKAHLELARKAAVRSAVLLKNEENILPLKPGMKIAVIGDFAFHPRYQDLDFPVRRTEEPEGVAERIRQEEGLQITAVVRGYRHSGEADRELMVEAEVCAREADLVLFFFGLSEKAEPAGLDRRNMKIPENQMQVFRTVSRVNPCVVGVLCGGAPVQMPWESEMKAILYCGLAGEAGAEAVMDLLTGRENPSGRLTQTWPLTWEDTPAAAYEPKASNREEYREGLFIGYRYYDTAGQAVRYPFGYGLSYTTFLYSDLQVTETGASFTVTNTGDREGIETAQLYVGMPDSVICRPAKELKGFCRITLRPGESQTVTIPFDEYTFRFWDSESGWAVEAGKYRIWAGSSVQDLPLTADLQVEGLCPADIQSDRKEKLPSYACGQIKAVSDEEFADLLGYSLSPEVSHWELQRSDVLGDLSKSRGLLGRMVYKRMKKKVTKAQLSGTPDPEATLTVQTPFRVLPDISNGKINDQMVDGMLQIANGHFFRGTGNVISGYAENAKANKKGEKELQG